MMSLIFSLKYKRECIEQAGKHSKSLCPLCKQPFTKKGVSKATNVGNIVACFSDLQSAFDKMCESLSHVDGRFAECSQPSQKKKSQIANSQKVKNSPAKKTRSSQKKEATTTKKEPKRSLAEEKLEQHMKKMQERSNKTMGKSTCENFVFLLTGIDEDSKKELQKIVKKLGGKIVEDIETEVTHIICNVNQNGVVSGRTLKYSWFVTPNISVFVSFSEKEKSRAVLSGIWAVSSDCKSIIFCDSNSSSTFEYNKKKRDKGKLKEGLLGRRVSI